MTLGAPLSQHLNVFITLKALRTPAVWGILWRFHFIGKIDEILGHW